MRRLNKCLLVILLAGTTAPALAAVPINTPGWSDSPFISRDGQRLYFSYSRWNMIPALLGDKPQATGPERPGLNMTNDPEQAAYESDLYVATRKPDGSWNEAVPLPFNQPGSDTAPMEAGDSLYFSHSNSKDSVPDIFMVTRDKKGKWGKPVALEGVNSAWIDDSPYVAPTGDAIWFASNRAGGNGDKDLYFSQKVNGAWTQPVNLGNVINTDRNEDNPWVSPDGSGTLYFNRDSALLRSTWKDGVFTKPEPVTIPGQEIVGRISFTDGEKEAFFTSADPFAKRLTIMHATKNLDGSLATPRPVD